MMIIQERIWLQVSYHNVSGKVANTLNNLERKQNFLTHVTLTTILEELEDIRTDLRVLVSREETNINDIRAQEKSLHGFYISLLTQPLSSSSIPAICRGWEAFEALDVGERQISLLLRGQQSCIMLTNYLAWYWLDVCIRNACNAIMDKRPNQCQWLFQLVQDVTEAYRLKLSQRQFSSSSYGITIPNGTATFQFTNKRNKKELEGSTLRKRVLATVDDILRFWLGYPSPDEGRIQAWLVHVLENAFGQPVLYLNSI